MKRMQPRPVFSLLLAVLALGSLAALVAAGESEIFSCQAEKTARAEAAPGFVLLAGQGEAACLPIFQR